MRLLTFLLILCCNVSLAQNVSSLDYVLGKIDYSKDTRFVEIPVEHANKQGMYLRKEAYQAFLKMKKSAKEDGISLRVLSAARNFNHQKRIWEGKWNGTRLVEGKNMKSAFSDPAERARYIMKYSSMPGTSRHHWGTDIDINSFSPSYFDSGRGAREYEWLLDNAHKYGFCQTYTEKGKERPHGYEEEKWHWTYLPIANPLLLFFKKNVTDAHMKGFEGAGSIPFEEVRKYVLGISSECH